MTDFSRSNAPLQDVARRHLVDDVGALAAGRIGFQKGAFGGGGGPTLVPEGDGEVPELEEIGGELADRLAARALRAVHIDRQADHQPADFASVDQGEEIVGILGEFGAADGLQRRRHRPAGIRERQPDRLRADIEAENPAAARHFAGKLSDLDDGHVCPEGGFSGKSWIGWGKASLIGASFMFGQNACSLLGDRDGERTTR